MYVVSLHSFQSVSNIQFPFICCLVSWIVHWRTWRKWTPRDFAPWIFMAGKLGGSGKTREIVLHSETVVSSTIYRLYKYRYWYRLLCLRIRYNHGVACWLPQAQFMNRGRCFKTVVMVGPWAFGEVILAEEIRAANRVGWRAGRAPNDRTNAYLWVPECDGLEGCMHSMQGCYWLFGRKQSWHVEKLSGMMPQQQHSRHADTIVPVLI